MKRSAFLALLISALSCNLLRAEDAALPDYSAEEVVKLVHLSRALKENQTLSGELRKGDIKAPVTVTMGANLMSFSFTNPVQVINLDLNDKGFKLTEAVGKTKSPVPDKLYAAGIRGTDLTYEDMSFRYLYFPNPIKLPSERFSTRQCYKIQLNNPQPSIGAYKTVLIWVDQESGGLLKMEGYNYAKVGDKDVFTLLKRCKVTAGMKVNDATLPKEMTIESFDPASGKGLGKTFLELYKPE